jgi:hypothetical protein
MFLSGREDLKEKISTVKFTMKTFHNPFFFGVLSARAKVENAIVGVSRGGIFLKKIIKNPNEENLNFFYFKILVTFGW